MRRGHAILEAMSRKAREDTLGVLALLALLEASCLAEWTPPGGGRCEPGDASPECCVKEHLGEWERCAASPPDVRSDVVLRATAGGVAVVMALHPVIGTSEQRGVELATDLSAKVEEALVRCVREADRFVNDHHFQGKSPSAEQCGQLRLGEKTTWAAYLGLFKHEQSWPCLHERLSKLMPGRYWLQARFRFDEQTQRWEFLDERKVKDLIAQQGWKGLTGTIEPDVILLDEKGTIVRVYDLKFPCPSTNMASWNNYYEGPWFGLSQGKLYENALQVKPLLVSPRWGVRK